MPATSFQPDLKSLTDGFVSRYAQRIPSILRREPGSQREEIILYKDMARRNPTVRFCMELVFLYCYALMGEYTHSRKRVEKDGRKSVDNCKGSWDSRIEEIMTVAWYGYSWTEVATDDAPSGKKILSKLRTLDPSRYNFVGDEKGVSLVQYRGKQGNLVELDYNTGIHITYGTAFSFDENHGSGRLEAAYPYHDLQQLLMPVMAIAAQRQATPILVRKTETGSGVDVLNADGTIQLNADGSPKRIPKGLDAIRQLAELGSAGVTAIDLDDDLYSIDQKIAGDFLLNVEKLCDQKIMTACMVPPTLGSFSNTGVGDSGLSDRHMEVFEVINAGLAGYICKELISQFFKPLVIYNFGDIGDYGAFPIKRSDPNAAIVAGLVSDAIARGSFSKNDLEAANKLRETLGMGELNEAEFQALKDKDAEAMQPTPVDPQQVPQGDLPAA